MRGTSVAALHRRNGRYAARIQRDCRRYSVYGRTEAEALAEPGVPERQRALDQPPPPNTLRVDELGDRSRPSARAGSRGSSPTTSSCASVGYCPESAVPRLVTFVPDRLRRLLDGIPRV